MALIIELVFSVIRQFLPQQKTSLNATSIFSSSKRKKRHPHVDINYFCKSYLDAKRTTVMRQKSRKTHKPCALSTLLKLLSQITHLDLYILFLSLQICEEKAILNWVIIMFASTANVRSCNTSFFCCLSDAAIFSD